MKILEAELLASAPSVERLPASGLPEIAFLGRSNVGKSSLLNALARRRKLARTSSTPGKTRELVLFRVATDKGEVGLVDLPGYGWAKVSRKEREGWQRLAEGYLSRRRELCLAILLQDLRRDWSEDESLLLRWLAEREVPGRVVLTKTDKLKLMRRKQRIRKLVEQIGPGFGKPIPTSAQKGEGLDLVWRVCLEHAFGNPGVEAPAGDEADQAPSAELASPERERETRPGPIDGDAPTDGGAI
ncbi:MAG: YihA family ribosome biogenesis GTP-binding protein [Deltaproteobacteria bacterium]|jgi:GTP-binding protein|nr:YihA family ribosome biogenesis GTP-binding protein [Deltaproteobacteria bacterium]MBW2496536.1 YihA family ribosome biogenesis GTP-binding protein [Deltaproteobacteria bacterium]